MPASVEVFSGTAPPGWDEIVSGLGGNIFHSLVWAEYQSHRGAGESIFLLARDPGGRSLGGAVALYRKSRRPVLSLLLREFEVTAHPFGFAEDPAGLANFVGRCEGVARDFGCATIVLGSNMSGDSPFVPGEHGYVESLRVEFHADLRRDRDELWSDLAKDQRERVRGLPRKGIGVEEGADRADLKGLQMVRENTQEKRSRRGQGYELSDGGLYDTLYDGLLARGAARLFVARHEGEVIAALFFSAFNGQAYSVFSGSTEFGYKAGAQSGLYWKAVETFKGEGFWRLNRGGVPASAEGESDPLHGIYRFKKRLGTVPVLCRSGEKVVSRARHQLFRLREMLASWRVRPR